ncbi:MAG: glycosyltransferase [Halieaceae bacterium]|jgi:uncharacterized protein|nr:glycosyltransferase [Halieaceae bacterium]
MGDKRNDLLLIQFAKAPLAGTVKTRMMPTLTAEEACALHWELMLWTCRNLNQAHIAPVELWISGDCRHPAVQQCRELGVKAVREQRGTDLGRRMYHALQQGLARYSQVILVGSDCPQIDAAYLAQAVAVLEDHSLVLGPATDGGYVLIGARDIWPEIFTDIQWGEDSVYADTVERINICDLSWAKIDTLTDIDRPSDLPRWTELRDGEQLPSR